MGDVSVQEVPVLYFHIPKTGGTSLTSAMRRAMRQGGALGLYDVTVSDRPRRRLEKRLERLSRSGDVRFIHGHLSPASVPSHFGLQRAVTLRRPIERLLSHFCYCYEHRHVDAEQFEFFAQPAYIGRKVFVGSDVAAWARRFKTDNYMTRFLTGRIQGEITDEDGRAAEIELRKMAFIGFTDDLPSVLAELAGALNVHPPDARRANTSNRSIVAVSPEEAGALAAEFLRVDEFVFDRAMQFAAGKPTRLAPHPTNIPKPTAQDRLARLLFTIRHRTAREWWIALGARFSSLPRRAAECLLLAAMAWRTQEETSPVLPIERIDLAAQ